MGWQSRREDPDLGRRIRRIPPPSVEWEWEWNSARNPFDVNQTRWKRYSRGVCDEIERHFQASDFADEEPHIKVGKNLVYKFCFDDSSVLAKGWQTRPDNKNRKRQIRRMPIRCSKCRQILLKNKNVSKKQLKKATRKGRGRCDSCMTGRHRRRLSPMERLLAEINDGQAQADEHALDA